MSTLSDLNLDTSGINRFYRTVWRWHFYAGLFVIPFMLILSTTGMIYLFKPQLDDVMYSQQLFVQPQGSQLSYSQQLQVTQEAYPAAKLTKIIPPKANNLSTQVELTTEDERPLTIFVNPYSGKILGDQNRDTNFQQLVRTLHGKLMLAKVGDTLVELAACWGLVLLITGLYLWWPQKGFSLWGTFLPRLIGVSRRIFWRDLHSVTGFYGAILVGFLILTGLPWSGFWGNQFAKVWDQFPAAVWNEVPQSTVLTKTLNQGSHTVPWPVERLPIPQSADLEHARHNIAASGGQGSATVPIDSIVALAQTKGAPPGFAINLPQEATGVYTVSAFTGDVVKELTLHIDQYSGQVLAEVGWKDYGLVPKLVEWGVAVHMGLSFGLANQLLMLFACLVVIILCVSGSVMWWQRRPQGRLGAPPMPMPQWKVPVVLIAVLGCLFPFVGISLVSVLALDYVLLSRIPGIKKLLG